MIRPLFFALALTLAGPSLAQSTSAPATSTPTTPDTPSTQASEGIPLAQFQARREKAYMKADTDGDGKISQAEWLAFAARRNAKGNTSKLFARIDTNHDGFIDHDELDAYLAKRFARLDKNHDGVLTPDELPSHKSAAKQAE